ncbi:dihydrofolate reductase family protein [Xinfangfangia pollutisoli]|uniref:dihydrofolate reductase family protein n=1 Tax=Xinfangfangia pollutisoli TaxID=2865960 RepID=UPI001CD2AE10|nr:dihydrofolate reductase family protein [Xinfangfangia pollutisoli]
MPQGHVFIATSLDGFIARADGDIAWLIARDDPAEDHGFTAFIAGIEAMVMGAGTWAAVQDFDPWPYPIPVLVLSRRLAGQTPPARLAGKVRFLDLAPDAAMDLLASEGVRQVYVDGGKLVRSFLAGGLIDTITLTQVPVLLGGGLPLFGPVPQDIDLQLLSSRAFPSGLVQSQYRVLR